MLDVTLVSEGLLPGQCEGTGYWFVPHWDQTSMIRPPGGGRAGQWPGPHQFGLITSPSSLYDGSQEPGMGVCAVSAAGDGMQEGR